MTCPSLIEGDDMECCGNCAYYRKWRKDCGLTDDDVREDDKACYWYEEKKGVRADGELEASGRG